MAGRITGNKTFGKNLRNGKVKAETTRSEFAFPIKKELQPLHHGLTVALTDMRNMGHKRTSFGIEEEEETKLSVEIVAHLIMPGILFSRGFLLSSELRESPTHQNCRTKCLWCCCLGNYLLSLPKSLHTIYEFTLSTDIYRLCVSTVQMPRIDVEQEKARSLPFWTCHPREKLKTSQWKYTVANPAVHLKKSCELKGCDAFLGET